jgi:hypothetical protein
MRILAASLLLSVAALGTPALAQSQSCPRQQKRTGRATGRGRREYDSTARSGEREGPARRKERSAG